METISAHIKGQEDSLDQLDQATEDYSPEEQEESGYNRLREFLEDGAEATRGAIFIVIRRIGYDPSSDLSVGPVRSQQGGDTVGTYDPRAKLMSIEEMLLRTGDERLIARVIGHECGHKENRENNEEVISDHDLEEVLNELSTARKFGEKPIAYLQLIPLAEKVARTGKMSLEELLDIYDEKEGNKQINYLIMLAGLGPHKN